MERTRTALITGASKGLGFALAQRLGKSGWKLLITARTAVELHEAKKHLAGYTETIAICGDVRDEVHLLEISQQLQRSGWSLDLVVNNASTLGMTPLRPLLDHPVDDLHVVYHTNTLAPISLLQKVREQLRKGARIINVSSDAAEQPYETWAAYGGSKAALDHMTQILARENPDYRFYAFDPGDMRTAMHQEAFPQDDISDRPLPEEHAVPALERLIEGSFSSGRYQVETTKMNLV